MNELTKDTHRRLAHVEQCRIWARGSECPIETYRTALWGFILTVAEHMQCIPHREKGKYQRLWEKVGRTRSYLPSPELLGRRNKTFGELWDIVLETHRKQGGRTPPIVSDEIVAIIHEQKLIIQHQRKLDQAVLGFLRVFARELLGLDWRSVWPMAWVATDSQCIPRGGTPPPESPPNSGEVSSEGRQKLSSDVREDVVAQYTGKCAECGSRGHHVHHKVPRSAGGTDELTNLVFLCPRCHAIAHNKPPDSFRREGDILGRGGAGPDVYRLKRVKEVRKIGLEERRARKEYMCEICCRTISPGETYLYGQWGYYDQGARVYYSHHRGTLRYPAATSSVHVCLPCSREHKLSRIEKRIRKRDDWD